MPVINEDSNAISTQPSSTTPPPEVLHVPAKNPRRSLGPPAEGTIIPYDARLLDMPPALASTECKDEGDDGDEETVVGQMTPTPGVRDSRGWKPDNMQRRCHLILIMAVVLVLLVGLVVGLLLGFTKT